MLTIRVESTEYRRIPITATADDGTALDPTSYPVEIGFSQSDEAPTSWTTASWVTDTASGQTIYKAKVLITAGTLRRGQHWPFARITANPEVVIVPASVPLQVV